MVNNTNFFTSLLVASLAVLFFVAVADISTSGQQRKPKKTATKKTTEKTASTPPGNSLANAKPQKSDYDISVKIENRKNLIFTKLTAPVLVIENRDKRPLVIHKVTLNEEYEFAGSKIKMKHNEKGYVYLPVTLALGESLENVLPDDYNKKTVYVDLETDSGVLQFKLED